MNVALLLVVSFFGSWIAAGEPYPLSLLQILFLIPVLFIIVWVNEELWWVDPKKRAAAGIAALTTAALALVTLRRFIPPPRPPIGAFDQLMPTADQIMPAATAAVFAGALLLSAWLIASSCHQGFKRWRYYRGRGS
jgi:hypothetical protein